MSTLHAISPIDGRYQSASKDLSPYFSEFGLIHYRVRVEIEYFIALCELPLPQLSTINHSIFVSLRYIYENFTEADALKIKEIEKTTNHDVKAVEYFIKEKFEALGLSEFAEFIHFGLTSQDINNTSIPLSFKEGLSNVMYPKFSELLQKLEEYPNQWKTVSLLARTHGQPASPTSLGKEFLVFIERLKVQIQGLMSLPHSAKFGGATGNFNAHFIAFPAIKWFDFANNFVDKLGLSRSKHTTQIEHYDNLAAQFDALKRINTILIDLNRDIWQYISLGYFKQKIKKGEIGSSAMPHKVNPIDFENAEGNLGIANALFEHLAAKLPISRLQRDLTDSTVLRNIGVPLAHQLIALKSMIRGFEKLELNQAAINEDLENNWAVVAEAIQTILRREGYPKPYEALLDLTRKNEKITQKAIVEFIDNLSIGAKIKFELKQISPFNYVGKTEN
ncbi:MAG: adenylosuccinate lyase [Bacteroidota bacterium]